MAYRGWARPSECLCFAIWFYHTCVCYIVRDGVDWRIQGYRVLGFEFERTYLEVDDDV